MHPLFTSPLILTLQKYKQQDHRMSVTKEYKVTPNKTNIKFPYFQKINTNDWLKSLYDTF